jgi:transposase
MLKSQSNGVGEVEEVGFGPVEGAVVERKRNHTNRPDPELVERPRRRQFSAEYKLRVVREADACLKQGDVGALLRREGLYSSHLSTWRAQRDSGALKALSQPRGRRAADSRDTQIDQLRQRAERAEAELITARKVIEVQGNVSALLEELLEPRSATPGKSTER